MHVEEQINVLRAQLLRSEQEKELMRIKLQEEQVQREKAQKQVRINSGNWRGLRSHAQRTTHGFTCSIPLQSHALIQVQANRCLAPPQAEVAKKLMFQRDDAGEGPTRKQSRRETWCPGKSAWAAPPGLAAPEGTPSASGTVAYSPEHSAPQRHRHTLVLRRLQLVAKVAVASTASSVALIRAPYH